MWTGRELRALTVAAALSAVTIATLSAAEESVLYVSPAGRDMWSGTLPDPAAGGAAGPFATLQRAREAVRQRKQAGVQTPTRVVLREGTYYLPETLVLGPEDSGTEQCPTTYEAYEGEQVVLSGGRPVTGWQPADGEIRYADLPAARGGKWVFRQLFVGDRREVRARYPNLDPVDAVTKGYLYARGQVGYGVLLSGLANMGDFLEHRVEVVEPDRYDLWVGYATTQDSTNANWQVTLDGKNVPIADMLASGHFRKIRWAKLATVELAAGRHVLRWERPEAPDRIVHFDAFVFSTNLDPKPTPEAFPEPVEGESQAVVQAESLESKLAGRGTHVGGFQDFECGKETRYRVYCKPGDLKESWARAPGAEVHLFAAWGWFDEIARVTSVDQANGLVRLQGNECQYGIREGNRFFLEGVREELDQPGEWYLDSKAGRVYYWPRDERLSESSVVAPALTTIVHLTADPVGEARVQHVHFRGLTFAHTDYTLDHASVRTAQDATVLLENAWNCSIENCTFVNVGGSAIRLHLDCQHNLIAGNEISEAGGNGVLLTAARVDRGVPFDTRPGAEKYAPIRNTITRNHLHHCGRIHKYVAGVHLDSRPASLAKAPGNVVSENHIHDMPRNGLFAFEHQGGNVFEGNHLHDLMLESDDGGGIHICQDNMECAPTQIRSNRIHDVFGNRVGKDATVTREIGIGVYLDGATSRCRVADNVIYRTSSGCVFFHGGKENTAENNVLVGDVKRQFWLSNYTNKMAGNRFRRNVVVCTEPESKAMHLRDFAQETFAECDYNLFWFGGMPVGVEPFGLLAEWQKKGFDANSLVADPLFADAARDDYSLRPESPALRLGSGPPKQPIARPTP